MKVQLRQDTDRTRSIEHEHYANVCRNVNIKYNY